MSGTWFYCLDHHTVEPYEGCRSLSRLGPYLSAEDAAKALDRVVERNDQWETDPRFNDPESDDGEDEERAGWGPFRH